MDDQPRSLRALFSDAEALRKRLESSALSPTSSEFQENLTSAIATYEECLKVARQVSLFSPNESLEDINSGDLQYLLINYHLAELIQQLTTGNRKANVLRARQCYESFLKLLDQYDMFSKADSRLYELYTDSPDTFATASTTDAQARRDTKISRFKEEKELKRKLEYLRQNPLALQNDDAAVRDLHLTTINLAVHQTFQSLELTNLELQILSMAPPTPPPGQERASHDPRERNSDKNGYSERLDQPRTNLAGLTGPILSKDGKPLRPFTLLDKRTQLQQGVFRPDHNLPTMSIDEYLAEEKKRGGMIEGGGEASGIRPEPDEDDFVKADEETLKARAWDDFKEENPKGSGNTINRG
ncbi:hypothetical protein FKW77_003047 [Venturia effusa]|uniref:Type 2A phosphatase-associated protein 42 n=1 Tax=Venturia effusa TaxID=50376 RepID=A0A517LC91_9PEZI|nr:hypothetical protein FKW77_003047 [Venturia effusa]